LVPTNRTEYDPFRPADRAALAPRAAGL